jgi:hypothetical protein
MLSLWTSKNRLQANRKNQPRCNDFIHLEEAVREARHQRLQETGYVQLHQSYTELDKCARNGCTGCRLVRHALLLAQITGRQAEQIEIRNEPVSVGWLSLPQAQSQLSSRSVLKVVIGEPSEFLTPVLIALTETANSPRLPEKRFDLVVPQIKSWLENCRCNHQAQCGNLSWSRENPRRLVEILSDTEIKLVNTATSPKLDYVALSYCWGAGGSRGNTTWENLPARQDGFLLQSLPDTIRDSLLLVRRLGLKHMWVDQLCIVQPMGDLPGEDWDLEGSRMHIVYGNALFTLNACSSEASTDGLLRPRKAWTYPVIPFYFEGHWLVPYSMTLKEVRGRSPLSSRAWVLQEERLSPRLLYFCSQRFYWSCFVDQHVESGPDASTPSATSTQTSPPHFEGYDWMSEAQAFLDVRFEGNKAQLHREWQDLVEAYVLRNMTQVTDRFRAISGLAAQYLQVYLNKDNRIVGQEYVGGLWRATFVQDLAWSVETASDPTTALGDLAPSWSWASLPLRTRIIHFRPIEGTGDFSLTETAENLGNSNLTSQNADAVVLSACRHGAQKRSVRVKGRVQKIMNDSFENLPWSEIQTQRGPSGGYSLGEYVDRHLYARDSRSGKLLIHEPTKRSLESQLDYQAPFQQQASGCSDPHSAQGVATGAEKDIHGLQIGKKTMLLLLPVKQPADSKANALPQQTEQLPPVYRRVGICHNIRDGFFDGIEISIMVLV